MTRNSVLSQLQQSKKSEPPPRSAERILSLISWTRQHLRFTFCFALLLKWLITEYTRDSKQLIKVKQNVSQSTSGCELTTAPVNTPTPPLSIQKYIFVHNFFGKKFFDIIFLTDYTSHFIVSIQ